MKDLSRRFKNDFREGEAQGFVGPAVFLALLLHVRSSKDHVHPQWAGFVNRSCTNVHCIAMLQIDLESNGICKWHGCLTGMKGRQSIVACASCQGRLCSRGL